MKRALFLAVLLASACQRHSEPQAAPEDRTAERAAIAKADADVRAAEAEAAGTNGAAQANTAPRAPSPVSAQR